MTPFQICYNGEMIFDYGKGRGTYGTRNNNGSRQTHSIEYKKLGINGEGIGYYKRNIVFIPGALVGEEVYAEITKVSRNFSEAKVLKVQKIQASCDTTLPCL